MSKIMKEIIRCIEQEDEFREKYYDTIDRLDEQENALIIPRRIPSIYPLPILIEEKKDVTNLSH